MLLDIYRGEDNCNIFVGNWSCEDVWYDDNAMKMPVIDLYSKKSALCSSDELFIYLARKRDIVILRKLPDIQFINYLSDLHIEIPTILVPQNCNINKSLGEIIVHDCNLICILREYVLKNKRENVITNLIPYGVTRYEEELAQIISARLFSQNNLVSKLNCKITLNILMKKHKINFPKSMVCNGINELEKNAFMYLKNYGSLVIKEIYGSAGTGVFFIDTEDQIRNICSYITHYYKGNGAIIIQQWHDAMISYNHQYIISNEHIKPVSFSKQLFYKGESKIVGSYFEQCDYKKELYKKHYEISMPIIKDIQDNGYIGIVGFDSLIDVSGDPFFPIIDINCRINLSTIFQNILVSYFPSRHACFIGKDYYLSKVIPFNKIKKALEKHLYSPETKEGILILNFNSLNENLINQRGGYGRLYFALLADTVQKLRELYTFIMHDENILR